jgi:hypothetical protein
MRASRQPRRSAPWRSSAAVCKEISAGRPAMIAHGAPPAAGLGRSRR